MSGDLGGQECSAKSLGPVRPIQRWGNVSFRNRRTCMCQCGNMKFYATAVHVVQVSFIWGSWLQKYKVLKLGHSLWNTLYVNKLHDLLLSRIYEEWTLPIAEEQGTDFLRCSQVPFHKSTWNLDPLNHWRTNWRGRVCQAAASPHRTKLKKKKKIS